MGSHVLAADAPAKESSENSQTQPSAPANPPTVAPEKLAPATDTNAYPVIPAENAMGSTGKQLFKKSDRTQSSADIDDMPSMDNSGKDPMGFEDGQRTKTTSSTYLTMGILFMVSLLFLRRKKQA